MATFNLGEFMTNAAISNLKDGAISDTLAISYVGNYCTKGWITEDEMQTALERIMTIASGEPDPAEPEPVEEVAEEIETESIEVDTNIGTEDTEVETGTEDIEITV